MDPRLESDLSLLHNYQNTINWNNWDILIYGKDYYPALAISVYHTPTHIWEIPIFINELAQQSNLQYKYYLRAHAHKCFDTIFYAVLERQ